jgi:hypothetical protein
LIKPEVEKQHADQARSILDSLAGVAPGDRRTAAIHVALETGQIDGDLAYIASLLLARDMGIPVSLKAIPQADIDAAQAFINNHPATLPVNANTASAKATMDSFRRNQSNTPIYVKVHATATAPTYTKPAAATASAESLALTPFAGGDEAVGINPLAGESTAVTFGTPVSVAGPSFAPTVHNHVTIQAAVIGSRFDVQRAVTKALRASQRLAGARV